MFTARIARLIAGKAGYTVCCLVASVLLVVAGYAHKAVGELNSLGQGITIGDGSSVGAMNILVMGLESRTNYEGQTLSSQLLTETHSGSVYGVNNEGVGSQDTDTLILIHIFAGGQKAVGFSIPRDDLVTYPQEYYPGVTRGKIDGAYYFAYANFLNQNPNMRSTERYLKANQAGQAAEIATVEAVTGQPVNHYVVMNLAGFFYLAQAFGGVEVCVNPTTVNGVKNANLYDQASGWNAVKDGYKLKKGGIQYLHLAADQALAYVRDRDSLPNTDLDRTHRQQAVIDYVIWELKHEGAFGDIGRLTALLSTASNYVITDRTFNLLDFATNMQALSGKNLRFETLPVASYVNDMQLNGSAQDVNIINVPYIQKIVKAAFNLPPAARKTSSAAPAAKKKAAPVPSPSTVTVDVYNGGSTPGLAGGVSQALVSLGYKAGAVADASAQSQTPAAGTEVFYGAGASANAAKIATEFGAAASALKSLPAGHVEVLLGTTSTVVPAGLSSPGASSTGADSSGSGSSTPTPAASSAANNGASGGVVTVGANARYGIPCVY
jgi:LCP family protein required for cell wall assembly